MEYESIASHSQCIDVSQAESFLSGTRKAIQAALPKILLTFLFLISNLLPLIAYMNYITDAEARGLQLEKGCHGPGGFFGYMSGILFLLLFRFVYLPFKDSRDDLNER